MWNVRTPILLDTGFMIRAFQTFEGAKNVYEDGWLPVNTKSKDCESWKPWLCKKHSQGNDIWNV